MQPGGRGGSDNRDTHIESEEEGRRETPQLFSLLSQSLTFVMFALDSIIARWTEGWTGSGGSREKN